MPRAGGVPAGQIPRTSAPRRGADRPCEATRRRRRRPRASCGDCAGVCSPPRHISWRLRYSVAQACRSSARHRRAWPGRGCTRRLRRGPGRRRSGRGMTTPMPGPDGAFVGRSRRRAARALRRRRSYALDDPAPTRAGSSDSKRAGKNRLDEVWIRHGDLNAIPVSSERSAIRLSTADAASERYRCTSASRFLSSLLLTVARLIAANVFCPILRTPTAIVRTSGTCKFSYTTYPWVRAAAIVRRRLASE